MNCAEATATVQAYVDGELDGVDRESVERHLVSCAGCSRRVHVQTRFRAAVRAHLHRPEVPFTLPDFPYAQVPLTKIGEAMPNAIDCHHVSNYVAGVRALGTV